MSKVTYIRYIPNDPKPYLVKVIEDEWLRAEERFVNLVAAKIWINNHRHNADVRDITHIGIAKEVEARKARDNKLEAAAKAERLKHYDPRKPRLIKAQ